MSYCSSFSWMNLGSSCSYCWYSTKTSGNREELRQSVITTFFSTDLKDVLLLKLCLSALHCLYPCNTCRVGGWAAVLTFANLWDPVPWFPVWPLPFISDCDRRKAMHTSSLGQNHTRTWKIYFFCLTHKCGSRIFRRGYSSLEEKIKIVPAKELKNLQREEEILKYVLMRVLLKKKWMLSLRAEFKLEHKVLLKSSPCFCQVFLSLHLSSCFINSMASIVAT